MSRHPQTLSYRNVVMQLSTSIGSLERALRLVGDAAERRSWMNSPEASRWLTPTAAFLLLNWRSNCFAGASAVLRHQPFQCDQLSLVRFLFGHRLYSDPPLKRFAFPATSQPIGQGLGAALGPRLAGGLMEESEDHLVLLMDRFLGIHDGGQAAYTPSTWQIKAWYAGRADRQWCGRVAAGAWDLDYRIRL